MPCFTVCLTRMVEVVTSAKVTANSWQEARAKVLDNDPGINLEWKEGDWCEDVECYSVLDEKGEPVYEWGLSRE